MGYVKARQSCYGESGSVGDGLGLVRYGKAVKLRLGTTRSFKFSHGQAV